MQSLTQNVVEDTSVIVDASAGTNIFSWSSLLNTFVFILAFTLFGLPFLKTLMASLTSKKSQQQQPQHQGSPKVTQRKDQQGQRDHLVKSSPKTGGISRSAMPSTPSQIMLQNERNESFKKMVTQISTLEELNDGIRTFIGQRLYFDQEWVLRILTEKSITPNTTTFENMLQILIESSMQENKAMNLTRIAIRGEYSLTVASSKLIFYLLKSLALGLSSNNVEQQEATILLENIDKLSRLDLEEGNLGDDILVLRIEIATRIDRLDVAMVLLKQLECNNSKASQEQTSSNQIMQGYLVLLKGLKGVSMRTEMFDMIELERVLLKLFAMVEFVSEQKQQSETSVNSQIDEVIVNSIIDLCFQGNRAKLALQAYGLFEKCSIAPSLVTYCILIKGCGSLKQYEYAMTIYDQMKKSGIAMNEVMLGCLIDTCVKCDQLERAEEIISEEHQIKLNTIIYTTLLKGYTKQENMQKALKVFSKMKSEKELAPNIVSYNSLMECAVQCRDLPQMKAIFAEIMSQTEESKRADLITFSTYIKGLFKHGEIDEALEIFEGLRQRRDLYKLDEIFYNSILDGLFKAKFYARTRELYEKMKLDNVRPSNVTFSILIKLNNAQNRIDDALQILPQMKRLSMRPGLIVYTCLIQACIKHKRIKELKPLYEDMRLQNVRGDAVFYNTLISGFIFNHCIYDALVTAIDTLERQIFLNEEVYTNLLNKVLQSYDRIRAASDQNRGEKISGSSQQSSSQRIGGVSSNSNTSLTADEIQQQLQKILKLMRKHSIRIEMELYKTLINLVFVSNPDEKKEALGLSEPLSRAKWGQQNNISANNAYTNKSNSSNGQLNGSTPNKVKARSFHGKQNEESSSRRFSQRSFFSKQSTGSIGSGGNGTTDAQQIEPKRLANPIRMNRPSINELKKQLLLAKDEEEEGQEDQKSLKMASLKTMGSNNSSNSLKSYSQKASILSNNSEEAAEKCDESAI